MRCRTFIRLLGDAAVAWLLGLAARVQGRRVRRIGDLEWMIKIATVLCALMVLVFSSENSAAQQSGIPAERHYSPPERYALEHCRPEPYTSESLVGSGPTPEEYMGFPPWAAWKKIPSIAVVSTETIHDCQPFAKRLISGMANSPSLLAHFDWAQSCTSSE